MELSKIFTNLILGVIKAVVIIIAAVVLTIGFAVLIAFIERSIFVPDEFVLWTLHDSSMRIMYIFEGIIIGVVVYYINRKKPDFKYTRIGKIVSFMKNNKGKVIPLLGVTFAVIIYYMIFNVTVFYSDRLINYSFTRSKGKEYSYSEIKSISTGFYRKNIPLTHSKGQFYYIIQMKDGRKINLNSTNVTKDDKDIYLTVLEFDKQFVNAGVPKTVDKEYFYVEAQNYDKVYSDRIKSIVDNLK
jgi:hypothetical protein